MRHAIVALALLAACSGEKTKEPPGKGQEQQKEPPCCTEKSEPWAWQDPTGPSSLGIAASVLVQGSRVLVGTYHDVLISADAGATWNPSARLSQGREIVVQTKGAMVTLDELSAAVFTSADGSRWDRLFPEILVNSVTGWDGTAWVTGSDAQSVPHVLHSENGLSWQEVDAASNATTQVVPGSDFLLSSDAAGTLSLSDDGAKTWSPIPAPPGFSFVPLLASWKGSIYTITQGDTQSIASSPDRGATWNSFAAHLTVGWRAWFAPSPDGLFLVTVAGEILRLRQPGGDWEDIERPAHPGAVAVDAAFGGPDGVFVARGGALWRWNESASAFQPYGSRPTRSLVFAMAADGENLWALVDGREVHRSPDGGKTWTAVTPPPGSLTCVAAHGGSVWVGTLQDGLQRSDDGGATWHDLSARLPQYNGTAGEQPRDIDDLLADDTGLYVATGGLENLGVEDGNFRGTSAGMLLSTDGGDSFQAFTRGLPSAKQVDPDIPPGSREAVASLGHVQKVGTTLFVDTAIGPYRSTDGGKTWSGPVKLRGDVPVGEMRGMAASGEGIVAAFLTDPAHPAGLFRSTDGGATFDPVDTRPPGNTIFADLVRSPRGLTGLMVTATAVPVAEEGVWESLDEGATWTRAGTGAPPRGGQRLLATAHELLVSTNGAGVARLPTDGAPKP